MSTTWIIVNLLFVHVGKSFISIFDYYEVSFVKSEDAYYEYATRLGIYEIASIHFLLN